MKMDLQVSSKINYLFLPSLKYLALVKVASTLWNQRDVRDMFFKIRCFSGNIKKDDWQLLENTVVKNVSELHLPRELGKLLISYVQPVGFQILDWINFHMVQHAFVADTELPSEFSWTPQGTIDNKKVAETLLTDKGIGNCVRFRLACIYCLEEYIALLSKELPSGFYKEHKDPIIRYWSYYVVGDIDQLLYIHSAEAGEDVTLWQMGFEISLCAGNETGTRYFLKRLAAENRANILVQCSTVLSKIPRYGILTEASFSHNHFANSICHILSEMNADELTQLVSVKACDILHWLLYWPWQNSFLRTVRKIWRFLCPEDYYSLLQAICDKIFAGDKDFDYQNLFYKFWNEGSTACKHYVLTEEGLKSPLSAFAAGDKKRINLIFKATTMIEREEFIFSDNGIAVLRELLRVHNYEMLTFLLESSMSAENESELCEKYGNLSACIFSKF